MTQRLSGKVAVVTGAASGIGLATVVRFVEEGARVLAADKDGSAQVMLEGRFGAAVRFVRCDVTQLEELRSAIETAVAHFGGLDILFNNAGAGGAPAGVEGFDAAGWDATHALLLRAVAAGTAYAVPHMKRRGGGAIINTSSVSALQAGYMPLAYSVAKAGVLHYTRVAAAELAPQRIRINAVVPGFIATRIFGGMFGLGSEEAQGMAERIAERSGRANPVGRSGRPEDIAQAVAFLASDEADFITGTALTVDGGLTIGPRHSWDMDPTLATPMTDALGVSRGELLAMRANAIAQSQKR
ncbi:MAG: SDR family oxidoreductase [Nitrospira sp. BO4]|jgi:NAD(P)-dependent dehydrogenase (short-subunit alcohol dehydrogenase family)|nr:SDR family oxidoreductase [Nitrospira sp. BO4]